jgi:DNA-binding NarL/FixJ family response regulator
MVSDRGSATVRLLIVIEVRLYREGLAATLRDHPRLTIVGTADGRAAAVEVVRQQTPDLVIIDVALPESLDLMRDLRAQTPATRIVAFAVHEDITAVLDCAEAGAAGFVTASASVDELVLAMERTIAGELLCSPRMAAELLRRAAARNSPLPAPAPRTVTLTSREQQVLVFIKQGLRNKEIASALNIAESTVKNHVHHLLKKLDVRSRSYAAANAAQASARGGVLVVAV